MTTKDYLDEYAELWEVQHKGSEDTVERNYRKLEELAKELEASIRNEVMEEIINIIEKEQSKNYPFYDAKDGWREGRQEIAEDILEKIKGITLK